MGSSSTPKKDKKKEKRRRSAEDGGGDAAASAKAAAGAPSATATSASGGKRGGASKKGGGKRHKVSVKLAKGVPSADSREQDKADPLVLPPMLTTFPHGPPRDAQALRFRCRASSQSGGQRQRRRLQVRAETAHVVFEGEGPAVARKARAKYVVGVYSKSRQAVTLYPVESLLALGQRVRGTERQGAEGEEEEEGGALLGGSPSMSYAERRKSLVEAFGTKKKRRVMQSQEENRIRAEGVVGLGALGGFLADSVKAVKAEADAQGQAPSAAEASRAALLPPYDAGAPSLDAVYRAERVLPGPDAWAGLEMDARQLAEAAAGGLGLGLDGAVDAEALRAAVLGGWRHWPTFLRQRVEDAPMPTSVPEAEDSQGQGHGGRKDARWTHLCALLLLRHLFDLYRLPPVLKGGATALARMLGNGVQQEQQEQQDGEDEGEGDGDGNGKGGGARLRREPANEMLAEACLDAFFQRQEGGGGGGGASGGRYSRTKPLTDKLLLHILVLCLIVGGYRVSATKIAQDLRMSPGDCATLFRETGATVKRVYGGGGGGGGEGGKGRGGKASGGDEVVVELALPLKFPEVKRVIRAKK